LPDMRRILKHLPAHRQTLLFSATMPDDIRKLAHEVLRQPVTVQVDHTIPLTTVAHALYPVDEQGHLPPDALEATFDRYFAFAQDRATGGAPWTAFTPYEVRTVGSFILLGAKERAHAILDWLFSQQRPEGWNHWAEVVWRDPSRAEFVGDMPHTWVGSDFVNAVRAMFLYEHEEDSILAVGAGLRESWLTETDSVWVDRLPSYYGAFGYSVTRVADTVRVTLRPERDFSAKGILVVSPLARSLRAVLVDGRPHSLPTRGTVRVSASPAVVTFIYQ